MQNYTGRSEAPVVAQSQAPKGASPLHIEIGELKTALEIQTKAVAMLKERLAPLFRNEPAEVNTKPEPEKQLAEMPTRVRDCRFHAMSNTSQLEWLLDRLEV